MDISKLTLAEIAQALAFIVALAASVTAIAKYFKTVIKTASDGAFQEHTDEIKKMLREEMESITVQLDEIQKDVNDVKKNQKIHRNALMSLAADRLNTAYNIYHKNPTSLDVETYRVLDKLYSSYSALGGNGVISKQMEYIRGLDMKGTHTDVET